MKREVLLAGVVILYNAEMDTIVNIDSYIGFLKTLYVVDNGNSNKVINELKKKYDNVIVIHHNENMGISTSLNEVLEKCCNRFTHLLTMDQDSRFTDTSMKKYYNALKCFDWDKTLGVSPCIIDYHITPMSFDSIKWEKVLRVITSGNVISVDNANIIGLFDENLFIDEVDFEFCYKGNLSGFMVYQCTEGIYLRHSLGNKNSFVHKIFKCMNHGDIRKYYMVRNRLYVYSKYHVIDESFFFYHYIVKSLKSLLDIVLFEKNKLRKLKYSYLGIRDFYQGRMGKRF